jgi:hypothetical protein
VRSWHLAPIFPSYGHDPPTTIQNILFSTIFVLIFTIELSQVGSKRLSVKITEVLRLHITCCLTLHEKSFVRLALLGSTLAPSHEYKF